MTKTETHTEILKKEGLPSEALAKGGYKKTKLGWIPEDWELKKLSEFGSFSKGKGISKSDIKKKGIPCVLYGELYTKHKDHIKSFSNFIDKETAEKSHQIKNGDLLFAGSGETAEEIGMCAAYLDDDVAYAGGDIIVFTPQIHDSWFLGYLMNHELVNRQKYKLAQGYSVVHLYSSHLKQISVPLPPLPEQKKIAKILSTWDRAIDTLDQLIAKKEELKKGLMQQLLTGKKRFPKFVESKKRKKTKIGLLPEEWNMAELKSILKTSYLGGNYENSETNNGIPLMKMGNLDRGYFKIDKIEYVPTHLNYEERHILKKGFLLLNTRNTLDLVGKVAIWRNELELALFNSNLLRLVFKGEVEESNEYMNYYFNSYEGLKQLRSYATGTTSVAAIYTRDLRHLKVPLPTIEEQRQICSSLSTLVLEIDKLNSELEAIKTQKKGLMQQLLTGRMRVKLT